MRHTPIKNNSSAPPPPHWKIPATPLIYGRCVRNWWVSILRATGTGMFPLLNGSGDEWIKPEQKKIITLLHQWMRNDSSCNPLKMIWFCYNTHFPLTPARVYSGLVFNRLIVPSPTGKNLCRIWQFFVGCRVDYFPGATYVTMPAWYQKGMYKLSQSCWCSVDKTTDSQSWGPQF